LVNAGGKARLRFMNIKKPGLFFYVLNNKEYNTAAYVKGKEGLPVKEGYF